MVDEVSGLGAIPFDTDAWELDVVVTGSQKAWMTAPGLAMVALSDRAWAANATARMPRFYFDLAAHRDFAARGETPWTPAVSVIYQLDVALGLLEREGAEAIVRRHAACAAATRAGLTALGFALYGDPRFASPTVTAAWVPDGLDWKAFNAALLDRQLVLAGGQGKLAGKVFRVGHLGQRHARRDPRDVRDHRGDAGRVRATRGAWRGRRRGTAGRASRSLQGRKPTELAAV